MKESLINNLFDAGILSLASLPRSCPGYTGIVSIKENTHLPETVYSISQTVELLWFIVSSSFGCSCTLEAIENKTNVRHRKSILIKKKKPTKTSSKKKKGIFFERIQQAIPKTVTKRKFSSHGGNLSLFLTSSIDSYHFSLSIFPIFFFLTIIFLYFCFHL